MALIDNLIRLPRTPTRCTRRRRHDRCILATEGAREEGLQDYSAITGDCWVEAIMKDNNTIRNDPSRVVRVGAHRT